MILSILIIINEFNSHLTPKIIITVINDSKLLKKTMVLCVKNSKIYKYWFTTDKKCYKNCPLLKGFFYLENE